MTDSDDLERTAGEAMADLSETTRKGRDQLVKRAGQAYERAADVARTGYEATSEQVATWPLSSLLVAMGVGVGIGWILRGSVEEEQRRSWLTSLYGQARGRVLR